MTWRGYYPVIYNTDVRCSHGCALIRHNPSRDHNSVEDLQNLQTDTATFRIGNVSPLPRPENQHLDNRGQPLPIGPVRSFTAKNKLYTPQALLYHATSLGPGTHKLMLTLQMNAPNQKFAVDYAVVFTTTVPSNAAQSEYVINKVFSTPFPL